MTNHRAILEAKTKEELIEELLERLDEVDNLEVELAGNTEAEAISDAEADKYANLLREADGLVVYFQNNELTAEGRERAGFPDEETFLAALKRHGQRIAKYWEGADRQAQT